MYSLRRWFYRPKKEDSSKLALFYWADEELTMVASELDSFDGRTDPDRCSVLVSQLRLCQDKVLSICNDIMDDAIPDLRANRDFRAKFPDDVLHENLAGQLWFGAECLAAGSNIIHREIESSSMRPLAKALTRALENVRCLLREQSLKNLFIYSDKVREALRIFDRLFAEFELCYVSAMVSIKTAKEYHLQQEIIVLFSETLIRALKIRLVTQDMVDDYDPSLMFTIPRLAIVWGLLLYPDGPFNVDKDSADLSELFRPFCNLLFKIRDLLWTLSETELHTLEKMLCSLEEPKIDEKSSFEKSFSFSTSSDSMSLFFKTQMNCKQFIHDFYAYNFGTINPESIVSDRTEEKTFLQEKHSLGVKHFGKLRSDSKFQVEFDRKHPGTHSQQISPDTPESDIDTVVSDDLDYADVYCGEKKCDSRDLCPERNIQLPRNKNSRKLHICDPVAPPGELPKIMCDSCSYCSDDNLSTQERTTSSLENRLSQLHDNCTCGVNSSSQEHLTPSREIMQQVMRRVEIVPPGQRITNYSSSVENSPRAYHHGLLSHSFPTHAQNSPHIEFPTRARSRRHSRRRSLRHSTLTPQNENSPTRCYDTTNQSSSQSLEGGSSPLLIPRVRQLREDEAASYSSCSSCQSISSISSAEWDSTSPDTSSYNSECQDDEEIALALQAAEIASQSKARSRFKSSRALLHKLFVCVSGVADQLQTNYAGDLRNILKSVFDMNCTKTEDICDNAPQKLSSDVDNRRDVSDIFSNNNGNDVLEGTGMDEGDGSSVDSAEEVVPDNSPVPSLVMPGEETENGNRTVFDGPPAWMPDELCPNCVSCQMQFTILRRRHHCRNCGKIFCSRCSSNSIPLPRFGHLKPVRVCNQCFMYELANLVMQRQF